LHDQSELAIDTRTGNKIGHVIITYQKNLAPDCMTYTSETGTIFLVPVDHGITWTSVMGIIQYGIIWLQVTGLQHDLESSQTSEMQQSHHVHQLQLTIHQLQAECQSLAAKDCVTDASESEVTVTNIKAENVSTTVLFSACLYNHNSKYTRCSIKKGTTLFLTLILIILAPVS